MSDKTMPITGGCLCGAVRYESSEPPQRTLYCHCRMCQRAGGGPFKVSAFFRSDAVHFTRGRAKLYQSSDIAERVFLRDLRFAVDLSDGRQRFDCHRYRYA